MVPAVLIVAQARKSARSRPRRLHLTLFVVDIIIAVTLYATKIASLATMQWLMLACLCISLVVNFVLVCASIVRLLQARARVRNAELGSGAHYVALIRILVFSGALYMLGTILTIILRTTMYATLCYVLNSTILVSGLTMRCDWGSPRSRNRRPRHSSSSCTSPGNVLRLTQASRCPACLTGRRLWRGAPSILQPDRAYVIPCNQRPKIATSVS